MSVNAAVKKVKENVRNTNIHLEESKQDERKAKFAVNMDQYTLLYYKNQ